MKEPIKLALGLIAKRDRFILLLVVGAQAFLGLLDMLGIALLGLVVGFAASSAIGGTSGILNAVATRVGMGDVEPIKFAIWLALIAALLLVAKSILSFLVTRATFGFLARRQAFVSGRLASLLLRQPLITVHKRTSQESAFALTTGVSSAMLGILGQAVVVASEIALLCVLSVGLFLISPLVTVFTYIYFLLVALVIHRLISKRAGRLGVTAAEADIQSLTLMQNAIRSYREVFVTGRRQVYASNFQGMRWVSASVQADLYLMTQVPKYVFDAALVIGGGLLVFSQSLSSSVAEGLATIAVFYIAASRIMPSLMRMQGALIDMKHARGMAKSTFELAAGLGYSPNSSEIVEGDYEQQLARLEQGLTETPDANEAPSISITSASFRYPDADREALLNIDVQIPAGSSVAIVGSTGAGKSTLADLILGVLEPDHGQVLIGSDSPKNTIFLRPGSIGYVPQDIVVVDGTIRENVALGLPTNLILDDLIWESLNNASLGDFLRYERTGLDTHVGEHGMRLSGGQRQRLGLARALYTRPKLLVLDEATSALDASTENEITGALRLLRGATTQVIIAHRLATVRECDQVVFLQEGRIEATGSFEEVRSHSQSFDRQATLLGL